MTDRSRRTTNKRPKSAENLEIFGPVDRKNQTSASSVAARIQGLFSDFSVESFNPSGDCGKILPQQTNDFVFLGEPDPHITALPLLSSEVESQNQRIPHHTLPGEGSLSATSARHPGTRTQFADFSAGVTITGAQEQAIPPDELSSLENISPHTWESLQQGRPVTAQGEDDQPSLLAFGRRLASTAITEPTSDEELPALLLEVLDNDPQRTWSDDEILLVEQVTDQLTLALENARLFEEAQLRAEQLAKLNVIGLGLTSTLDLKPLLDLIIQSAVDIINCEAGSLFLIDDNTNELVFEVVLGPLAGDLTGRRLEPGTGFVGEAVQSGKAIIANDVHLNEDWSSIPGLDNDFITRCLMVAPMRIQSRAVGAIEVINKRNGTPFSQADQELLMAFTTQATIAIENARLYTNELRRRQIADSLSGIARTISSALSVHQIAEETLDQLAGLIDYRYASIQLLLDQESERKTGDKLSVIAARPQNADMAEKLTYPNEFVFQILKSRDIHLIKDAELEPEAAWLLPKDIRSLIVATLLAGDEVVGLLSIGHNQTQAFRNEDIQLIQPVCAQIAVAIQNARLFEQTQKARDALQLSVRYQQGVAQAVSALTERGFTALTEVLENLGQASQASRAYYIETQVDGRGPYWRLIAEWRAPGVASQLNNQITRHLPINSVNSWINRLRSQGFNCVNANEAIELESEYFATTGTRTALQFAVSSRLGIAGGSAADIPGCIGFDQVDAERTWTTEEIAALSTAASALSNTIVREDLFSQVQINLAETEAQYQASARLNAANSFNEILTVLRQHTVIGNANVTFVSLNLFDSAIQQADPLLRKSTEKLIPIASWTAPARDAPPSHSYNKTPENSQDTIGVDPLVGSFLTQEQLLHPERSTVVFDVFTDPRIDDQARTLFLYEMSARSLLYIPLNVSGKWIGHIIAAYRQTTGFTEQELRRLTSLAGQAAVAVEGLRLVEETRQRNEELATINQITASVSRSLDLSEVLSEILEQVLGATEYEGGLVSLVDQQSQQLYLAVHQNMPQALVTRLTEYGLKGTPCDLVFRSGQPIYQSDLSAVPDGVQVVNIDKAELVVSLKGPLQFGFHSYAGVPLISKGTTLGTICLFNQPVKKISPTRLSLLTAVGQQLGVVVENVRAYALAQKAVEEISEADRLKTQFLANMSHELRTPLNSIIGFSRVILKGIDGPVTDQQTQDLTAIYNSGQHLLGLINDVLDLSKIEAGKMEIALEENVNLADIVHSVMSTMVGLVKGKPIELRQELSPDLPLLTLDPIKIRQVLINLLSNAAKFTDQGAITIKAEPYTSPSGQAQVIVRVSDTGEGIAPADQTKLFQPFSQVDGSLTRKTGGSGLGLSICQHLVRMHGGEISLDSQVGEGSTFSFTLPIKPANNQGDNQSLPTIKTNDSEAMENQAPTPAGDSDQKVIMVIERDPKLIDIYRRYLTDCNFTIIASTELDQASMMAAEIQPFAITLDVSMQTSNGVGVLLDASSPTQANTEPEYDGWTVLEALKTSPETKSIPVIVCTMVTEQERAMRLGANAYLLKPILQEDLVRVLDQVNN